MRMRLPLEWIAALRFLGQGRVQTSFIIAGAAIGVAVIAFMSALLAGIQANTIRRSLLSQAHIVVRPAEEIARPLRPAGTEEATVQKRTQRVVSIDQWRKLRDEIRRMPGVSVASATVSGSAFAIRGEASKSVLLTGIEPEEYMRVVPVADKITSGSARLASTDVLVGSELAHDLGLRAGDKLRLVAPSGATAVLSVTGIFDLGSRGVNERNVYVALRTAQDLLDLPGGASRIEVTLDDIWEAEKVSRAIAAQASLQADSWIRTNEQFFLALKAQTIANYAIRFSVGVAVALGIASVLVVSVVQRSREIGILRAMGASRRQVMGIFLIQGGLVGLAGSFLGTFAASLLLAIWRSGIRNADGTPLFPVTLDPTFMAWAALAATVVGTGAAITAARRAANLDPVVAIRG